jgi:hypothetical protein
MTDSCRFTTLLAREYELPDTLTLWDSFFSDIDRFSLVFYTASAMVCAIRTKLLPPDPCDFSRTLYALQDYQTHRIAIETLIRLARRFKLMDQTENGVRFLSGMPVVDERAARSTIASLTASTSKLFGKARDLASQGAKRLSVAMATPSQGREPVMSPGQLVRQRIRGPRRKIPADAATDLAPSDEISKASSMPPMSAEQMPSSPSPSLSDPGMHDDPFATTRAGKKRLAQKRAAAAPPAAAATTDDDEWPTEPPQREPPVDTSDSPAFEFFD